MFLSFIFFNFALSLKAGPIFWLPGMLFAAAKYRGIIFAFFYLLGSILCYIIIAYEFLKESWGCYFNEVFPTVGRVTSYYESLLYFFLGSENFLKYSEEVKLFGFGMILVGNLIFLLFAWTNLRSFFRDMRIWPLTMKRFYLDPDPITFVIFNSVLISAIFSPYRLQ